jgi:hypothetical protein
MIIINYRPLGVSSISIGSIEIMLNRKTDSSNEEGLNENLYEVDYS